MIQSSPTSTLFPYTTLFRSALKYDRIYDLSQLRAVLLGCLRHVSRVDQQAVALGSEEPPSELQSRAKLICGTLRVIPALEPAAIAVREVRINGDGPLQVLPL